MRCWSFVLIVGALFISICTAVTTTYLCTAVETSLQTQRMIVADYVLLADRIARLERKNADLEAQTRKLSEQLDFIAAAARMGWDDAYRFLRNVRAFRSVTDEEAQGTIISEDSDAR